MDNLCSEEVKDVISDSGELRPRPVPGAYNPQMEAQVANNKLVLDDIEGGKVFDDIIVEYDQVLEGGFTSSGYNVEQLINNMVLPSFEDAESVAEDLKQYYMQLIDVSQKRYDEVKGILEAFYRSLVTLKREELDLMHASEVLSEEDFEIEQSTFTRIAEEHHDKLRRLREGFDVFNTSIDARFDEVMRKLRQWSGYGEEDRLSSSFRNSEAGSIISLNPDSLKMLKDSSNRQPSEEQKPILMHEIVSPTPKFTHASKPTGKEN